MNIDKKLKDAARRTRSSLAGATVPPWREHRPSRWVSAALAATLVVVVVGAAALLNRGTTVVPTTIPIAPGTTSTTQPTTTTTGSSVTTTAVAQVSGLLITLDGWRNSGGDPAAFGNVAVTSAVTVDGSIVVAGCASGDGGVQGFPAWTSRDAISWEQATGLGAAGTSGFGCLSDITATPFGLYARGGSLFHSVDGRTWQEVDLPKPDGVANDFVVDAIFSTADRVTVLRSTVGEGETRWAVLSTTTNGTDWTEGPADSAALFDSSTVGDVLATEAGLIAVGASPGGEFVPTAAVWVSSDGLHWQRVTNTGVEFTEAFMNAAIETQGGFVVVGGSSATGLMAAWTSPDGITWHREPGSEEQTDADVAAMSANAIVRVDGILFAAGEDFDARRSDPQGQLALWMSADGTTWSRMQDQTYAVPFDIVRLGSDLIGFWPPRQWIDVQQPVQVLVATPAGRCEDASWVVATFADRLPDGVHLESPLMVFSRDPSLESWYYISARIVGGASDGEIATWAFPKLDPSERTLLPQNMAQLAVPANEAASSLGFGMTTLSPVDYGVDDWMQLDGATESQSCVRDQR